MLFKVPELLTMPEKITPILDPKIFNEHRYFLIEGGRVSGKTQAVARFILYLCDQQKLRVVCGREIQKNVEESVYTVLADLIRAYNLNFEIMASEINHKTNGSSIRFRGFREQGAADIKGLEGVSILWVDEAESITKPTLDVVIPTIRKDKSKIIFTMNRYVEADPVFVEFATRTDCLHLHVDYRDNPFCPEKSRIEAERCQEKSYPDYEHIWLGAPLARASDHLFGIDLLRDSIALDMDRIGVRKTILSCDPARMGDCETAFVILQSRGPVMWEMIHLEAYKHKKADETIGKHAQLHKDFDTMAHVVDCDGLGGPIADMIESPGFETMEFYCTKDYDNSESNYHDRRTDAYHKLLEWLEKGWLKILNDSVLIEQLLTIRYKTERSGKRRVMSKEDMMKEGVVSPDRADALMMAIYFADSLMGSKFQDSNYAPMKTQIEEQEHFVFDATQPAYSEG